MTGVRRYTGLQRTERGSGLVEMALCLPILFALLFGLMEASMLLFSYHFISEAAREGTRWAIVRGAVCPGLTPCPAAAIDIQTYIRGLGYPSIDPTLLTVTSTWSAAAHQQGTTVTVQVQYPFSLSIPFVPAATVNMSSTSAMVISE